MRPSGAQRREQFSSSFPFRLTRAARKGPGRVIPRRLVSSMMQQYTDKNLTCVDCGGTFLFSADDQEFYARKGFTNEPKRCKPCRDKRKASSGEGRERTFYDVTCDACGKQTQVPFNPTNGKPVYCRECYSARRSQQAY